MRSDLLRELSSSREGTVETIHSTAECLISHPLSLKN